MPSAGPIIVGYDHASGGDEGLARAGAEWARPATIPPAAVPAMSFPG